MKQTSLTFAHDFIELRNLYLVPQNILLQLISGQPDVSLLSFCLARLLLLSNVLTLTDISV